MKKLYLGFLIAGGMLATSCSMNELPSGTLNDETAIQTVQDAMSFRNGIYANLRSITSGAFVAYQEIQADMFVGTQSNGNRIGMMSLGSFNASNTELQGLWSSTYSAIANVNYFLGKVDDMVNDGSFDASSHTRLQRYRGEAHWARAYYYYLIADKYCQSYTNIDPTTPASGAPLQITYSPSGDYGSYPGRSTLAETFAQIEADLDAAYTDLKAFETSGMSDATNNLAPNAPYLSTYAVRALQARIALLKGDWQTAIDRAEEVIAGPFRLAADIDEFENMWYTDNGTELIFVPFGNQAQASGVAALGSAWINADPVNADYIGTENALSLYVLDDIRGYVYFETRTLSVNGMKVPSPCFVKYPGNPSLNTGSVNALKNLPKPLRLSEMYLIVAEAAAMTDQHQKANDAYNDLRAVRIEGYTAENLTGQPLISAVRDERTRELLGEGYRISDLRRWGQGFTRSVSYKDPLYDDVPSIVVYSGSTLSYTAGDKRYLLPIPTGEIETNPQLAGQQNPGY